MNQLPVILCWIVLGATFAGLIPSSANQAGAGEPVSADAAVNTLRLKSPDRRVKRAKVRNPSNPVESRAQLDKEQQASPRYQMLSAGKRVVILDTVTGETRIIEPETSAPQQRVEIGKSWVTVTVLVNRAERSGTCDGKPSATKSK